jgi:hypothetical protein
VIDRETDSPPPYRRRTRRIGRWIDLMAAAIMASATVATAWSAYQSAVWNSQEATHRSQATVAIVRVGKFSNLAMQRTSVHVNLFVQWASAVNEGDTRMADFLFTRFPEPLKAATLAWRAAGPLTSLDGPASPFDMPEYVLPEKSAAESWEGIANEESALADSAGEHSKRYMLFTTIFASALFFAGISGKIRSQMLDLAVLGLGGLTLLAGVVVMLLSPRG